MKVENIKAKINCTVCISLTLLFWKPELWDITT